LVDLGSFDFLVESEPAAVASQYHLGEQSKNLGDSNTSFQCYHQALS